MTSGIRSVLLVSAAFVPAALAAQTVSPATTATPQAAADQIQDIVVTAQKRREPLQTVPVAATVVSGEAFERGGNFSVEDLKRLSPSLTFDSTTSARNNSVRIRGIGTNTTSSGIEPETSTVVDGVVLVRSGQSSASQLLDVDRIEVLRGPQGTLFGKNASAGVVAINTNNPTREFEATAAAMLTDDHEYQVRGAVSGPLGPVVSGRIAGFYRNFRGNAVNVFNGEHLNGAKSYAVRGKLLFDLGNDFTAIAIADYGHTNSDCCARPLRELDLAGSTRAGIERPSLLPVVAGPKNRFVNNDTPLKDNSRSFIGSLQIDKGLGDFTLTSITAYQYFKIDQQLDDDQTSNAPVAGGQPFKQAITSNEGVNGYTQELRLASPQWDRFDFVAGLYAFNANVLQVSSNIRRRTAVPQNQLSTFRSRTEFTNYAAFGQGNVHITDKLTVLVGARYTYDKVTNAFSRIDDPLAPFRNRNTVYDKRQTNKDFSWKAGAEYKFTPDVFAYATYAQGYKGPGFNVSSDGTTADPLIRPESADSYEIGAKVRLFERRLAFNIAAFDATYENFAVTANDPATNSTRLLNAAELRTKGFEIDVEARPFTGLSLTAAAAYIRSRFDVPAIPCYDLQTAAQGCLNVTPTVRAQAIDGGRVPNSPTWKYNVAATYVVKSGGLPVDLDFNAGYVWTGRQQLLLNQDPEGKIGSYGLVNLSVGASSKDGNYRAEFFVQNLTDKFYVTAIGAAQSLPGSKIQFLPRDESRYVGVRLSAAFR